MREDALMTAGAGSAAVPSSSGSAQRTAARQGGAAITRAGGAGSGGSGTGGRLPTFLIVGAQKTGTTSLWHYLRAHPQVHLPDEKEPEFFLGDEAWARGIDWYRSLFVGAGDAVAVGEASTMYSMFPHAAGVPQRIRSVVPDVRLLYVLRHPIERMVSLYGHHLMAGWEHRPIEQALLQDARYTDSSRYAMQIEQYLRCFDRDQLLVLTSEQLRDDRAATLATVHRFLGVDDGWQAPAVERTHNTRDDQRVPRRWWWLMGEVLIRTGADRLVPEVVVRHNRNRLVTRPVAPHERVLDADVRRRLEDVLRPDLERLQALLGTPFDAWGLLQG